MLSEDADEPILEGEMLKYKPGLTVSFIKRWAQVTRREFKYYTSRYHSAEWLAKPLGGIPLSCIGRVVRVDVSVGKKHKFDSECFQFEVFPKKESSIHVRQASTECISNLPENKADYNKFVLERGKELMKVQARQSIPSPDTWTSREKEWESAEIRLLFSMSSKEQCDRWILLLNWLAEIMNQEIAARTERQ